MSRPPVAGSVDEVIPVRRVPSDVRARLTEILEPLRRQTRDVEIGLSVTWDKDLPARLNVDGDKVAWVVRSLVDYALSYVRRGNRIRPGGNVGVVARLAKDDGGSRLAIEVWTDGRLPDTAVAALRGARPAADAIGLALVREVVEGHSGGLDVRISEGELDRFEPTIRIGIRIPLDGHVGHDSPTTGALGAAH